MYKYVSTLYPLFNNIVVALTDTDNKLLSNNTTINNTH